MRKAAEQFEEFVLKQCAEEGALQTWPCIDLKFLLPAVLLHRWAVEVFCRLSVHLPDTGGLVVVGQGCADLRGLVANLAWCRQSLESPDGVLGMDMAQLFSFPFS